MFLDHPHQVSPAIDKPSWLVRQSSPLLLEINEREISLNSDGLCRLDRQLKELAMQVR